MIIVIITIIPHILHAVLKSFLKFNFKDTADFWSANLKWGLH